MLDGQSYVRDSGSNQLLSVTRPPGVGNQVLFAHSSAREAVEGRSISITVHGEPAPTMSTSGPNQRQALIWIDFPADFVLRLGDNGTRRAHVVLDEMPHLD
jgi:hypothetical protein